VVSYCLFAFLFVPLSSFAQSKNLQDLQGSLTGRVVISGDNVPAAQVRVDRKALNNSSVRASQACRYKPAASSRRPAISARMPSAQSFTAGFLGSISILTPQKSLTATTG
jgi:hypothetical protein